MFELIGKALYQWDLDRQIEVTDDSVSEVHFAHPGDENALVVEVDEIDGVRVASIPNILLQGYAPIKVWLVVGDVTVYGNKLTVTGRAKPDDYVYTETEVKRYETLEKRIEALEKNGSGGSVDLTEIETDIENLQESISKLSEDKADKTDTYTKAEVDAKIQNVPSGEGGSVASEYPKKVFEHEWKDNYDKIDVTAIDYENGILTVSSMPSQIIENASTTVRVFAEIKVEGITVPFKYGMMPKEIMETATFYYAKKVGENQIVLCHPSTSAEITNLTSSDTVDLTRWNLFVEKSRNKKNDEVVIQNLDITHKYKVRYYIPHSTHYCTGILIMRDNEVKFGSAYNGGYPSRDVKANEANESTIAFSVNQYETVGFRIKHYGYTESVMVKFPRFIEADIYGLSDNVFNVDFKIGYFAPFTTLKDSTVLSFHDARNSVYIQEPYEAIKYSIGNGNYILDGARCELWDYGEVF